MEDIDRKDMEEFMEKNENVLEGIAKEIVARRLMLKLHFGLWISVNILTTLLYYLSESEDLWYLWVLIPWGMALALHYFNYYTFRNGLFATSNEYFFGYHTFLFIAINILLIFIDAFTSFTINNGWTFDWFWYPLISWLGVYFLNMIIYYSIRRREVL